MQAPGTPGGHHQSSTSQIEELVGRTAKALETIWATTDQAARLEADQYLRNLQESPEGWDVASRLATLPNQPYDVRLAATQILHHKVQHHFRSQLIAADDAASRIETVWRVLATLVVQECDTSFDTSTSTPTDAIRSKAAETLGTFIYQTAFIEKSASRLEQWLNFVAQHPLPVSVGSPGSLAISDASAPVRKLKVTACQVCTAISSACDRFCLAEASAVGYFDFEQAKRETAAIRKILVPSVGAYLSHTATEGLHLWNVDQTLLTQTLAACQAWIETCCDEFLVGAVQSRLASLFSEVVAGSIGPFAEVLQLGEAIVTNSAAFRRPETTVNLSTAATGQQLHQQLQSLCPLGSAVYGVVGHIATRILVEWQPKQKEAEQLLSQGRPLPKGTPFLSLGAERQLAQAAALLGRALMSRLGWTMTSLVQHAAHSDDITVAIWDTLVTLSYLGPTVFNEVALLLAELRDSFREVEEDTDTPLSSLFKNPPQQRKMMLELPALKLAPIWYRATMLMLERDYLYAHFNKEWHPESVWDATDTRSLDVEDSQFPELGDSLKDRQAILDSADDVPATLMDFCSKAGSEEAIRSILSEQPQLILTLSNVSAVAADSEINQPQTAYNQKRVVGLLEVLLHQVRIEGELLVVFWRSRVLRQGTCETSTEVQDAWRASMPREFYSAILSAIRELPLRRLPSKVSSGLADAALKFIDGMAPQIDKLFLPDDWLISLELSFSFLDASPFLASRTLLHLTSVAGYYALGPERLISKSQVVQGFLNYLVSHKDNLDVATGSALGAAAAYCVSTASEFNEVGQAVESLTQFLLPSLEKGLGVTMEPSHIWLPADLSEPFRCLFDLYRLADVALELKQSGMESQLPRALAVVILGRDGWNRIFHFCFQICCHHFDSKSAVPRQFVAARPPNNIKREIENQDPTVTHGAEGIFSQTLIALSHVTFSTIENCIQLMLADPVSLDLPDQSAAVQIVVQNVLRRATDKLTPASGGPLRPLAFLLKTASSQVKIEACEQFGVDIIKGCVAWMQYHNSVVSSFKRAEDLRIPWDICQGIISALGKVKGRECVAVGAEEFLVWAIQSLAVPDGPLLSAVLKTLSVMLVPTGEQLDQSMVALQQILSTCLANCVFWPTRVFGDFVTFLDRTTLNDPIRFAAFLRLYAQIDATGLQAAPSVTLATATGNLNLTSPTGEGSAAQPTLTSNLTEAQKHMTLACMRSMRGMRMRQLFTDLASIAQGSASPDSLVTHEIVLHEIGSAASRPSSQRQPQPPSEVIEL